MREAVEESRRNEPREAWIYKRSNKRDMQIQMHTTLLRHKTRMLLYKIPACRLELRTSTLECSNRGHAAEPHGGSEMGYLVLDTLHVLQRPAFLALLSKMARDKK
jgi:hypothetical protein